MLNVATLLAGALVLSPPPVNACNNHTLEALLGAPLGYDLAVGQRRLVAWVRESRGERNVWVAQPVPGQDSRPRQLTTFTGDTGVAVGYLGWLPDDDKIVFARGEDIEEGKSLNIAYTPKQPIPSEIWIADASTGETRRLAPGRSPVPAPSGHRLAFVDPAGAIMVISASGGPASALTPGGLDRPSALTWSPDGQRIAFVSNREDHSMIGVVSAAGGPVRWIRSGIAFDRDPAWSPDGSRLAFVRGQYSSAEYTESRQTGQPFQIRLGDPASGESELSFQARPGAGSVYRSLDDDEHSLKWLSFDSLVFPWEATGRLNLYRLDLASRTSQNAVGGDFDIFSATVDTAHGAVAVTGDPDGLGILKLGVWKVGGRVLWRGDGQSSHTEPRFLSDGSLVSLMGDAQEPFRPFVFEAGTPNPLSSSAGLPALTPPQQVQFSAADGLRISGQLIVPRCGVKRKPAIVFFHGGPQRMMLLGWHPMAFYAKTYALSEYLSGLGFIVLSVDYRGGVGRGLEFREAPRLGSEGSSELADIEGAARYLSSRLDVDPSRIGVWGGSYGGLMTALALARVPNLYAAGVDYAGVHDWTPFIDPADRTDKRLQKARQASVISDVSRWRAPALIAHADADEEVPLRQSVALLNQLAKAGVPAESLIIPNEVHDLRRYASWHQLAEAISGFFSKKLLNDSRADERH